jgi:hypothetical protein
MTPAVYWQKKNQEENRLKQEEIRYAVLRREWERRFPADELSDEEVIPQSPPTVSPLHKSRMQTQAQVDELISRIKALERRFPAHELSDEDVKSR